MGLTASDAKTLIVNGEPREIAAKNLAEALAALDYADAIVATALNGEFVAGRRRGTTPVPSGRIEIASSTRGGGAVAPMGLVRA